MTKLKFSHLTIVFVILFITLILVYYQKTRELALENAHTKIDELLVNYKAFRNYISKVQKEEIYRLQDAGDIDKEYFNPKLLSTTYGAKNVNKFYNQLRQKNGQKPITLKFASTNPRNPNNKATSKESEILKKFNNNELNNYSEVIQTKDGAILYYAIPTKRTQPKCMRCHSSPETAPKDLIKMYGDKNGFYEKVGNIRALISTQYPLNKDLKSANKTFVTLTFITFIIFLISLYIMKIFTQKIEDKNQDLENLNHTLDKKVYERTKELEHEKNYAKKILDNNPNIIIVTNGTHIITANKRFFEFTKYKTIEKFQKKHDCICDYFTIFNGEKFPKNKIIQGEHWCHYIANNPHIVHEATVIKSKQTYFFNINAIILDDNNEILVTLQDITEQRNKEKLLFEQSKLASMGEMIGNIAHQWRQPLSIISTAATGMQLQNEHKILTDDMLQQSCLKIDENAQYLSRTIDDFKNFIKGDRTQEIFKLKDTLDSFLHIINSNLKSSNIKLILTVDENLTINGYKNELIQCFINIFNNSKDVLEQKEENKYIIMDAYLQNNNIVIKIKDNGGGIPKNTISKIFEPYFTTKHKSQGTGLGLHMTYNLIVDGMNGSIKVQNITYIHDNQNCYGAEFIITLPQKNSQKT